MDNVYVYQILKHLIEMSGSYVSSNDLASRVGISESTLFRNIESVQSYVADLGMYLSRVRGKGYRITGTLQQLTALKAKIEKVDFYPIYTNEERKALIFLALIGEKDGTKLESIGRELKLSDSTISKSINSIESDFYGYDLHIERRQGYGTTIHGNELQIRAFALRYILQVINKDEFLRLVLKGNDANNKEEYALSITERLSSTLNKFCSLKSSEEAFESIEKKYNIEFSDNSFILFLLYLGTAALRIGCKKTVVATASAETNEWEEIKGILSSHLFAEIQAPDSEYALLQKLIDAFRNHKEKPEIAYLDVADRVLSEYESLFNASASPRELIIELIAKDIAFLKFQSEMSFIFTIPFNDKRERSDEHREFADFVTTFLDAELGIKIPRNYTNELMKIIEPSMTKKNKKIKAAIACASGIGTSIYLERDIKKSIKELDYIHIVSVRHITEDFIHRNGIDLIISTVPISIDDVPSVCVALPLHKRHIESIKEVISGILNKSDEKKESNQAKKRSSLVLLTDYLWTKKTFRIQYSASDWKSAVKESTSLLQEKKIVDENYYTGILRITEEYGPYYVVAPGVAMPHARPEDGVMETGFSLVTLSEPVSFGHEDNDPVDIVLCLAAKSAKELNEEMIVEAMTLFEDEECLQLLRSAKNDEEFRRALLAISESTEE